MHHEMTKVCLNFKLKSLILKKKFFMFEKRLRYKIIALRPRTYSVCYFFYLKRLKSFCVISFLCFFSSLRSKYIKRNKGHATGSLPGLKYRSRARSVTCCPDLTRQARLTGTYFCVSRKMYRSTKQRTVWTKVRIHNRNLNVMRISLTVRNK